MQSPLGFLTDDDVREYTVYKGAREKRNTLETFNWSLLNRVNQTKMSCQAVVIQADANNNNILAKQSVPIPEPGPGQALVRVQYVAQNPTDGMHLVHE